MTDVIKKAIEAIESSKHWMHWANEKLGFGIDPKFPEWNKIKQALSALKAMKAVDVEMLKKDLSQYPQLQHIGWNDCLDHLKANGYVIMKGGV